MRCYPVTLGLVLLALPVTAQTPPVSSIPAGECFTETCYCAWDGCNSGLSKCIAEQCQAGPESLSGEMRVPDGANEFVDYRGFREFVTEVEAYRAERLITLEALRELTDNRPDVLLLDARSARAFEEGHMAGAVNLPLTEFTSESLAELIGPDRNRLIIIYCNNNFYEDIRPVQKKLIQVALNTQTFVNLYAYGYENVWELGRKVQLAEPLVRWTGTLADDIPPFETIPILDLMPRNVLPPKKPEERAGYRPR